MSNFLSWETISFRVAQETYSMFEIKMREPIFQVWTLSTFIRIYCESFSVYEVSLVWKEGTRRFILITECFRSSFVIIFSSSKTMCSHQFRNVLEKIDTLNIFEFHGNFFSLWYSELSYTVKSYIMKVIYCKLFIWLKFNYGDFKLFLSWLHSNLVDLHAGDF